MISINIAWQADHTFNKACENQELLITTLIIPVDDNNCMVEMPPQKDVSLAVDLIHGRDMVYFVGQ